MRSLALNTGSDYHLLDHIAPLAEFLQIPLVTTEEINYNLACRYYPQVKVQYMPDLEYRFKEIAASFDTLFECKYWRPELKLLFRELFHKEMELVFCPHGQSDKGYGAPLLAPYSIQDAVLLYGPLMLDMLKELKIPIRKYAILGNYRLAFYRKYQSFYDLAARKEVPLDRSKKTVLYAPTWKDGDGSTSFFTYAPKLINDLPQDWNLIIKLHPLLKERHPAEFYSMKLNDKKPNLFFLDAFPPIYPILSLADVYLGDASSVGYDFLSFNRPLYFLPGSGEKRLHSCGYMIDVTENIYSQMTKPPRQEILSLYLQAFAPVHSRGGKMKRVSKSLRWVATERTSMS